MRGERVESSSFLALAFILATDASTTGFRVFLSQEVISVLKQVGFTGGGLTSIERNYITTEQKCLAVV